MVDFEQIAASARLIPGVKVELIPTSSIGATNSQLNIGNLLNKPAGSQSADEDSNIVSKEPATYKDKHGTLIRYSDGSVVFQYDKKSNGQDIQIKYKFDNDKAFEKQRPSVAESYKKVKNGNEFTYKKMGEESYKYYHNGKVSHMEHKDAKGVTLYTVDYYKNGRMKEKQVFDNKDGSLKSTFKYKNENRDTQTYVKYDKDNKVELTGTIKYNGEKRVSSEAKFPNGNIASEQTYDENGKIRTQKNYHPNGKLKCDTEYYDNGVIKRQTVYDETGKITKTISPDIDDYFGDSAQISEGDCYLLATINSIRQVENGQEVLNSLITTSTNAQGEKVYTVNFPGAKLAAEGLKTDRRIKQGTIAITGTYTFTESELQEILKQAGKKYSLGDGNTILLEAAFEKYRQEVKQTLDANGIDPKTVKIGEAGLLTGTDDDNILAGGYSEDAMFILTGQKSQLYKNPKPEYGLDYLQLQAGNPVVAQIQKQEGMVAAKAVSEVDGKIDTNKNDIDRYLDKIMADAADGAINLVAVAGFATVKSGEKPGGHALTIKSVTADTVTLINPWHPDKDITMSREDFKRSVKTISLSEVPSSKPQGGTVSPQNPSGTLTSEQISQVVNGVQNGTITPSQPSGQAQQILNSITQNQQSQSSQQADKPKEYKVPLNKGYTALIKESLKEQGIEPTKENIKKAKEQFEALNKGKVHIYKGPKAQWRGNKYLLAGDTVKIPKFDV